MKILTNFVIFILTFAIVFHFGVAFRKVQKIETNTVYLEQQIKMSFKAMDARIVQLAEMIYEEDIEDDKVIAEIKVLIEEMNTRSKVEFMKEVDDSGDNLYRPPEENKNFLKKIVPFWD